MKSIISGFLTRRRRKKRLPVLAVCRNCGTSLVSRYCHNCGQYLFAGFNYSIKDIIYNAFDTIFAWDNKLFRTLKYLLFFPGKLTKEYLSGKVIRYVHPAKLFWFITIIFFAVFTFWAGPDVSDQKLFGTDSKFEEVAEAVKKDNANSEENINQENTSSEEDTDSAKKPERKKDVKLSDILDYIPYGMFLVVPFFAFLLQLFFYGKQHYYAGHLIFAFHFHSFIFLLFTIISLISHYYPPFENIEDKIFLYVPPLYFIIALFVVYRPKIWSVIWKVPFIMFIYLFVIIFVLLAFSFLIVRYVHGVDIFRELSF